jgi:hypothetical protein
MKLTVRLFLDWVLKTDHGLDGDSLSYLDRWVLFHGHAASCSWTQLVLL